MNVFQTDETDFYKVMDTALMYRDLVGGESFTLLGDNMAVIMASPFDVLNTENGGVVIRRRNVPIGLGDNSPEEELNRISSLAQSLEEEYKKNLERNRWIMDTLEGLDKRSMTLIPLVNKEVEN